MTTKKHIQSVVTQFNILCKKNQFAEAGELARQNKSKFIAMIKCGGSKSLIYAYKVCSIFNMKQTDCFNLIFN